MNEIVNTYTLWDWYHTKFRTNKNLNVRNIILNFDFLDDKEW